MDSLPSSSKHNAWAFTAIVLQVRRDVDGVLQTEDIIPNKQSLIVYSSKGYIKRMTPDLFSIQVTPFLLCSLTSRVYAGQVFPPVMPPQLCSSEGGHWAGAVARLSRGGKTDGGVGGERGEGRVGGWGLGGGG